MTLYLHPSITPAEIQKASQAGIRGVKSYPRGVTTNSDGGIENYEDYYPVFAEMEKVGMVLNLHGEVPSDSERVSTRDVGRKMRALAREVLTLASRVYVCQGICVLNAEETFLQHLFKIHKAFPKLRIVLEHATTAAAVEAVSSTFLPFTSLLLPSPQSLL